MSSVTAANGLVFDRLDLTRLHEVASLSVEPAQIQWFAPTDAILNEVELHHDRVLYAVCDGAVPVGLVIVRRDPRDPRCWWLGWLLIDARQQGKGYGKLAFRQTLAMLARRNGCQRIRLQVTPGNDIARSMYRRAGFRETGRVAVDGDDVLELVVATDAPEPTAVRRIRAAQAGPPRRGRRADGTRLGSGAWAPLYAAAAGSASQPPPVP